MKRKNKHIVSSGSIHGSYSFWFCDWISSAKMLAGELILTCYQGHQMLNCLSIRLVFNYPRLVLNWSRGQRLADQETAVVDYVLVAGPQLEGGGCHCTDLP